MPAAPFTPWTTSNSTTGDPARRITWLSILLTLPLVGVGVRLADLQGRLQPEFLTVFSQTRVSEEELPARNGRILAADGRILADDVVRYDLLVHYRWLEQPADPQWLRRQAWSRLSRNERRQPALVAGEIAQVQARKAQLWSELSTLAGRSLDELYSDCRAIQVRVEHIWATVDQRRQKAHPMSDTRTAAASNAEFGVRSLWRSLTAELSQPPQRAARDPLVIHEQEDFHPLLTNVSADVAAEVAAHPERYPGVRIAERTRRVYPQGELAAHLLGVRKPQVSQDETATPQERGLGGLEQQYDSLLQGRSGRQRTLVNRHGDIVRTEIVEPPRHGRDVVLTLDPQLQRRTEKLLDAALERLPDVKPVEDEAPGQPTQPPQGGCLIALDVHTGAVLVAAAAPRFDANWLVTPAPTQWQAAVDDPRKPFYPRVTQMALPPGSVFKVASAVALLESGVYEPGTSIRCQGYLDRPDQHRCLTYRHFGYGHGSVDLSEALCRSCNVFFFTGARRAGPQALVNWATKFGIGQPTGIDLPGESVGRLPAPERSEGRRWSPGDTLGLAIGQSSLTVTPLQMARLMAAVANDGLLVTPHLVSSGGQVSQDSSLAERDARPTFAHPDPVPIPDLNAETLAAIREGLYRVVHDPHGTAYHSVRLAEVAIAGKTGTAEVGGGQPDHAWFAGYVPADNPRVAFAVVLEHGGSGGKVAGPVAREFVKSLLETGLLSADADLAVTDASRDEP
jgi:penicillin-binding protein 2